MNKIDLIIDALSVARNSVWSTLNQEALAYAIELKLELAKPTLPMSPEHLPQYIATNNIKPTTEGGGGAGGSRMTESQVYKQIVERLAEIDDDIARLRQQHLMLRVDIQILLEKKCSTKS